MKHKHLCRDCGKELYECDWCDEEKDHAIGGRCINCQEKLGEFWAIESAPAYGIEIYKAKYDYKKTEKYRYDSKPYMMVGINKHVELPFINRTDLKVSKNCDDMFNGCSNSVWIITEEDKNYYISLNNERKEQEEKQKSNIKKELKEKTDTIFKAAKETGEPQILSSYMDGCNDENEEYNTDCITVYANPDGTITKTRQHTW